MNNRPTCFKNPENPSCIDLILTNCPRSFQNSTVIETGLSDFHKMVVTVMKTTVCKIAPKIISYRDYSDFCNDSFRDSLLHNMPDRLIGNCVKDFDNFTKTCNIILEEHAPCKKKYVRGNHSPFMNKTLLKAIMLRTRLRNVFLNNRTRVNRKKYSNQRNLCVSLLRKSKREYYSSLNEKKYATIRNSGKSLSQCCPTKLCLTKK